MEEWMGRLICRKEEWMYGYINRWIKDWKKQR